MQTIASNKRASHDYLILEKFDVGLVLTGSEVKSLRINTGSIKESYILEKNGELWLTNCHIKKYSSSNEKVVNTTREKKILLKKKEYYKIVGLTKKQGMTIIPISLYFNQKGFAKLSIGVGKGKKKRDKRESIKEKEWNLKKQRMIKNR